MALKKELLPAFGWAQHPKAGQNTQQMEFCQGFFTSNESVIVRTCRSEEETTNKFLLIQIISAHFA